MSLLRSPSFPFWAGCLLALAAVLVLSTTTHTIMGSVLAILGMPLLFEAEVWRVVTSTVSSIRGFDSERVHREAYNPRGALPRYAFFYACLFGLLYLKETGGIPDDMLSFVILIVGPVVIWMAWAIGAFARDIRLLIKRDSVGSPSGLD